MALEERVDSVAEAAGADDDGLSGLERVRVGTHLALGTQR
jgi:hypothetical protein